MSKAFLRGTGVGLWMAFLVLGFMLAGGSCRAAAHTPAAYPTAGHQAAPALAWQARNAGLTPRAPVTAIVVDPAHPQVLWAGVYTRDSLFASADGAAWWPAGEEDAAVNSLQISSDGRWLYAATARGFARLDLESFRPQASRRSPPPGSMDLQEVWTSWHGGGPRYGVHTLEADARTPAPAWRRPTRRTTRRWTIACSSKRCMNMAPRPSLMS